MPNFATYGASKAFVRNFSEALHYELKPRGIRVTCLCPGFTRTEFHERLEVGRGSAPDFMWLDADDLVATALKDHAKGKVFSVPGAQYKVVTAAARLVPSGILQRFQSLGRK